VRFPSATRRNIYVRSEAAGHRVMASITRFIDRRLKLQVNAEKSAVGRPWQRSFLGYTLREDSEFRRCVAEKALARFKSRVRELTRRSRGVSLERVVGDLNPFLRGYRTSADNHAPRPGLRRPYSTGLITNRPSTGNSSMISRPSPRRLRVGLVDCRLSNDLRVGRGDQEGRLHQERRRRKGVAWHDLRHPGRQAHLQRQDARDVCRCIAGPPLHIKKPPDYVPNRTRAGARHPGVLRLGC
jgi:hypothetical protein